MGRLIDADALIKNIDAYKCPPTVAYGLCIAKRLIEESLYGDADRPPKGKWRLLNGKWTCSECGNKTDWPLKICNVCASEMEIEL